MTDAAEQVWVCEKGHVDDFHLDEPNPDNACSRCGGTCQQFSLDGLAREYIEQKRRITSGHRAIAEEEGRDG